MYKSPMKYIISIILNYISIGPDAERERERVTYVKTLDLFNHLNISESIHHINVKIETSISSNSQRYRLLKIPYVHT